MDNIIYGDLKMLGIRIKAAITIICVIEYVLCPVSEASQKPVNTSNDGITILSNSEFIKSHITNIRKNSDTDKEEDADKNTAQYIVNSLRPNFIRITTGTAQLNIIHIKVTNENSVPISGAKINVKTDSGLIVVPGWHNGVMLTRMETDKNGEFTGMLISEFNTIERHIKNKENYHDISNKNTETNQIYGISGVLPGVDEFNKRIKNKGMKNIKISAKGTTLDYWVDVDMGPALVIEEGDKTEINSAQWVGNKLEKPVAMKLIYYQRVDHCMFKNQSNKDKLVDDDMGDWRDEKYTPGTIKRNDVYSVQPKVTAERYDGFKNSIKLDRRNSDAMSTFVTMDHAKGIIKITYSIPGVKLVYSRGYCEYKSKIYKLPTTKSFSNIIDYEIYNTIPLRGSSPKLSIVVKDEMIPNPDPDPLPEIKSYSGMNLKKLVIMFNKKKIFDKTLERHKLGQYPNYIEAITDGKKLDKIDKLILGVNYPGEFEFIYYPTLSELNMHGENIIEIKGIEDRTGNKGADSMDKFTIP